MKKSEFHYELPAELIAQAPLAGRTDSRLLVVPPGDAPFEDHAFAELPDLLQAGDLLVFNDTRVIPARLFGHKASGGRVEILIERLLPNEEARAQLGVSKPPRPGSRIALDAGGEAEVLSRDEAGFWHVRFHVPEPLENWLLHAGRLPLPPYIQREPGADDAERYQTVFAKEIGAVAAPTAGLHFDAALLDSLAAAGIDIAPVTLHVGYGTFKPVRADRVDDHVVDPEPYDIPDETAQKIAAAKRAGRRVVAVGTTTTRALESAAQSGNGVMAGRGDAKLFIRPGYEFRCVDALVTNFHLPRSSLLMLVAAFAGRPSTLARGGPSSVEGRGLILDVYRDAISRGFRFYSYGDAMLVI